MTMTEHLDEDDDLPLPPRQLGVEKAPADPDDPRSASLAAATRELHPEADHEQRTERFTVTRPTYDPDGIPSGLLTTETTVVSGRAKIIPEDTDTEPEGGPWDD